MKINLFLLIFTLSSLIFSSCQTDIDFSGKETSTLLVVNSILTPDSLIKVQVSESKFFLDDDAKFNDVLNATVKIWVNDQEKPTLLHMGNGLYVSSYLPKAGDKIKLTAKNDKYAEVSSFTEVVPTIPISSIDTSYKVTDSYPNIVQIYGKDGNITYDTLGYYTNFEFNMKLHIKDPKELENYYRIRVTSIDKYSDGFILTRPIYFNTDDPVFESTSEEGIFGGSSNNQYSVFSDELFNGKDYGLRISSSLYERTITNYEPPKNENPNFQSYVVKKEFLFELQNISKSYYLFLKSREAGYNVIEFFSEPVQIYNNIEGGIGIFGNYNSTYYKLEIPNNMSNY